jgi:hypothetical protein
VFLDAIQYHQTQGIGEQKKINQSESALVRYPEEIKITE